MAPQQRTVRTPIEKDKFVVPKGVCYRGIPVTIYRHVLYYSDTFLYCGHHWERLSPSFVQILVIEVCPYSAML